MYRRADATPLADSDNTENRHPVIDVQSFAIREFKTTRIQSQLMQYRGMDIGHIMSIFDRMKTDFIRDSMRDAALDASAGHPD